MSQESIPLNGAPSNEAQPSNEEELARSVGQKVLEATELEIPDKIILGEN